MKNLRIGGKLAVAFSIAIVALIGLGIFSLVKLGTMDATVTYMAVDQHDKQVQIAAIDSATASYRNFEAVDILSTEEAEIRKAGDGMDAQAAIIAKSIDALDATLKSATSRAALDELRTDWTRFLDHSRETRHLADANKNAEALASFRAEGAAFDAAGKAADDLQAAQAQNAKTKLADAHDTYITARMLTIVLTLAVVVLLGVLMTMLIRQIAKPIAAVTNALSELARGKMDAAVPVDDRRDEVGDLAKAMTGLRDQLAGAERAKQAQTALIVDSVGTGLSALAAGDLTVRIDADLNGPFAKLKTDFNAAMDAMGNAIGTVTEAASGINSGAGDIRQASDDLSQRTEQQAASLEETAAAMDEITSTVRETAAGAAKANAAVSEARAEAEHSGEVVKRAVDAMGGIERSSAEISEIISVIDGIAFQTNLLALNAGVEAARAGDAGKGFAVVASEVRALAQRSAEAAKDVKTRITASGVQVEAGVELVSETGKALDRIIARIAEIATLVATIATSAEHQATGLQQVNTAVSEMDGVTQQNAAMVEEATAAARSLATEAEALAREVARFKLDGASAARPVVHQLQERAAEAGRRIARAAPRVAGNTALANDDWSEF